MEALITEKTELEERTNKLGSFIESDDTYRTLPEEEKHRLMRQFGAMYLYLTILQERIKAFNQ